MRIAVESIVANIAASPSARHRRYLKPLHIVASLAISFLALNHEAKGQELGTLEVTNSYIDLEVSDALTGEVVYSSASLPIHTVDLLPGLYFVVGTKYVINPDCNDLVEVHTTGELASVNPGETTYLELYFSQAKGCGGSSGIPDYIVGKVINMQTNQPIPGAIVTVFPYMQLTADNFGIYYSTVANSLTQYFVSAEATGFEPSVSTYAFLNGTSNTISLRPYVTVPDVVSLTQADAIAALHTAGVAIWFSDITTAPSDTVPAGLVISQSILPGTTVIYSDFFNPINIVVSLGLQVTVPEVTGLALSSATSAITAASLTLGDVTEVSSDSVPAGHVISQIPAGDTQVASGSAVNLTVSSGPAIPLDAEFSADKQSGKAPLAVQFVDLSTSSLTITSHEWDFGDPSSGSANTSTQPNPSHAYSQPGIYTVTLSVANAADSDVEVKQQYITVTPADTWQLFVPFFGDGNAAGINSASSNGAATLLCVQNLANEFAQLTISYGNPQGENVNPNAGVPSEITLGPYQLLAWRPSQADTDYEFNGPVGDSTAGNGTVLIESTQPVAGCVMTWSFFNTPEFGNSERDLTAYTMPSKATSKLFVPHFDDPGAARFEPLTSKNLASFIGVQNTGDSAVSIDPAYYLPSGLPTSRSDSNPYLLAAGATVGWRPLWHYDLGPAGQEGPGYVVRDSTEGRGGVLITSSTDGAALAGRLVRYDFQKGAVASYTLPSDGSTKLYAPFYSDFGSTLNDPTPSGTATLLSVQNILATAGTFSVAYYDANGSPAGSFQNIPISPFSSVNWRPARQDPAETALATPIAESTADNGSAVIQSDSTLVGRVMIIDNNANALATAAYTMPGGGSTKLAVPIFLDNGTWHTGAQTAAGYAALIAVQNLSSAPINMSVSYYNVDGDLITDVQDADDEVPFVLAGYSGVSWRPFSDLGKNSGLPNGEGSGRKIVDASEVTGTAIIEATGPIAGRALIYDYSHFGEYGLAAYALPPADPNPKGAKP